MQNAFEKVKELMKKESSLAHPDFAKPFHIETNASDLQLG